MASSALFHFDADETLGVVRAVDTASVVVEVENVALLRKLQVNRLVVLHSSKPGQYLIGVVQKITRDIATSKDLLLDDAGDAEDPIGERNAVRITLIGTFIERVGQQENVFRRTLESVPEIEAQCFPVEGDQLTRFMRVISHQGSAEAQRLSLGTYTLDESADAYLNANRFFQRHAVIVGSTGSGKSWTTARLLEQIAALPHGNAILFDIHGEYHSIEGTGVRQLRIAGPGDLDSKGADAEGVIYLPYWLLSYEDMLTMLVDRSDNNAPNQAMVMSRAIIAAKQRYLTEQGHSEMVANFTIDSPVPYSLDDVSSELAELNSEMVEGARGQKQGDYHGKLSRLMARMDNKRKDRRLGFMFQSPTETMEFEWLAKVSRLLMAGTRDQHDNMGGVKIVDFSEVPSDILPLVVARVASLVFFVAQWTERKRRHPIALLCDEAHLYMPNSAQAGDVGEEALKTFERIAKEGRKYGVGLVVISQRPSEVSRTVLSQCNNFVSLRLTNAEDQSVVQRLLPDSLGSLTGTLPVLDTGEALVVGDASLLPSRIRITEPTHKPDSGTVNFWDDWLKDEPVEGVSQAVQAWRNQSTGARSAVASKDTVARSKPRKKATR